MSESHPPPPEPLAVASKDPPETLTASLQSAVRIATMSDSKKSVRFAPYSTTVTFTTSTNQIQLGTLAEDSAEVEGLKDVTETPLKDEGPDQPTPSQTSPSATADQNTPKKRRRASLRKRRSDQAAHQQMNKDIEPNNQQSTQPPSFMKIVPARLSPAKATLIHIIFPKLRPSYPIPTGPPEDNHVYTWRTLPAATDAIPPPPLELRYTGPLFMMLHDAMMMIDPVSVAPIAYILRDNYTDDQIFEWILELNLSPISTDPIFSKYPVATTPEEIAEKMKEMWELNKTRATFCHKLKAQMAEARAMHASQLFYTECQDVDIVYKGDKYIKECEISTRARLVDLGARPYSFKPRDEETQTSTMSIIVPNSALKKVFPLEKYPRVEVTIKTNTQPVPLNLAEPVLCETIFPHGPFWKPGFTKKSLNKAINEGCQDAMSKKNVIAANPFRKPMVIDGQRGGSVHRGLREGHRYPTPPDPPSPALTPLWPSLPLPRRPLVPLSPSSSWTSLYSGSFVPSIEETRAPEPNLDDDAWWQDDYKACQAKVEGWRREALANDGDLQPFIRSLTVFHTPQSEPDLPQPPRVIPAEPIDIYCVPEVLTKECIEADDKYTEALRQYDCFHREFLKLQIKVGNDPDDFEAWEELENAQLSDPHVTKRVEEAHDLLMFFQRR